MRKQAPTIEWQIVESEPDWDCLHDLPGLEMGASGARPQWMQRFLWRMAALLLLLASVSGGRWRTDQPTLPQPATAVTAAGGDPPAASRTTFQTAMDWRRQFVQEASGLSAAIQTHAPAAQVDVTLSTVDVQGDQAVVNLVTTPKDGVPAYRQTRFYQRTTEGWQQAPPAASLWGPERSLETPYFIYHFRQNDAAAVIAVAPQIDALYTILRRNFGLPASAGAAQVGIEVSVTQSPGSVLFQPHNYERFVMNDRLIVASPALYVAPVELTDAELLAQSVILPLLTQLVAEANEQSAIDARWQPVMAGLGLWQVWEMDLPLASWQAGIVQWLYRDLPGASPDQVVVLPEQYEQLCAAHTLWMQSPTELGIPLLCVGLEWEAWYFPLWGPRHPPTHLNQITLPMPTDPYEEARLRGQTVALATLIEYAVATYGRERLPALVAGWGQYESWDTLIPAVFGVSATEFEAGWQAYLVEHYSYKDVDYKDVSR